MEKYKFKLGGRVRVKKDLTDYKIAGKTGTIREFDAARFGDTIVEFDENIGGWDDFRLGITDFRGLYVSADNLELIEEKESGEK